MELENQEIRCCSTQEGFGSSICFGGISALPGKRCLLKIEVAVVGYEGERLWVTCKALIGGIVDPHVLGDLSPGTGLSGPSILRGPV